MPNKAQLNNFQLNAEPAPSIPLVSSYDDFEFDGFSLQNANIVVSRADDSNSTSRELPTAKIPRNDGEIILGDYFRQRKITLTGYLNYSSNVLLEAAIDTLKRRLTLREGLLTRKINGAVRAINATLTNSGTMFSERQGYHISFCPFSLEFMSVEPMWHDLDYTASTTGGVTNLAYSDVAENLGNYKAPAVLIVLVDAASSVTGFTFKNNTTGQQIAISKTINAGDVLIVDGENRSMTLNGSEVDYDGIFPFLNYGSNSYTLTTTGASIQFTSTIKYKKTYL